MLGHDGRLKGDLTCFNWDDETFWIMGSYYLREWHMRWFHDHLPGGLRDLKISGHVEVKDISDNICGYSISGPNARKVLEKLTSRDISDENFKFIDDKSGKKTVKDMSGYLTNNKQNRT